MYVGYSMSNTVLTAGLARLVHIVPLELEGAKLHLLTPRGRYGVEGVSYVISLICLPCFNMLINLK